MKHWSRGAKVLALTSIGVMLVSLDISIVNVAFGSIAQDFGPESRRTLTWVFSAYNIAYAAGLLTAGRLADAFGRKRAFLTGLSIFMLGSILCAFSPTALVLVAARVVQAIGGAILTPASLALVLPEFPVEKRSSAIGIWGAVGAVSAASGPTVGASSWTHSVGTQCFSSTHRCASSRSSSARAYCTNRAMKPPPAPSTTWAPRLPSAALACSHS